MAEFDGKAWVQDWSDSIEEALGEFADAVKADDGRAAMTTAGNVGYLTGRLVEDIAEVWDNRPAVSKGSKS